MTTRVRAAQVTSVAYSIFRWVLRIEGVHATVAPGLGREGARCRESTRGVVAMHTQGLASALGLSGWGGAGRGGRRWWLSSSGSGVAADRTGPDRVGLRARRWVSGIWDPNGVER